MISHRLEITNN